MTAAAARAALAALASALVVTSCSSGTPGDALPETGLRSVELPDMSRSDQTVQTQARERFADVTRTREGRASARELADAYGALGMIFHAAEYYDAAEPAYVNAQTLAAGDARWPYYLGHVYRQRGNAAKSIESFQRALDRQPDDVPTLVWLSRAYVDQGRAGEAESLLSRANTIAPTSVAVFAERGQLAIARRDFTAAVTLLRRALEIEPKAASLHAPLANAYRASGDTAAADRHAKQWAKSEVPLPDPLMDRIGATLESGVSYESRGVRAFEARQWAEAADLFRKGLEITPPSSQLGRSLRHKLGLALSLGGDPRGAEREFEEAIRLAPPTGIDVPAAQAHYGLGVINASNRRDADAIEHLSRAVAYDPKYAQAHLVLADLLRRNTRDEASLSHYTEAIGASANAADARFGYALALVRLKRYVEARQSLDEAVAQHPDRVDLTDALSRILSASPDARARDGERALRLIEPLAASLKRVELGETLAMALAEIGRFDAAIGIQQGIIGAAERAGLGADARRMMRNLRLYQRRQPCREPWPPDAKVFRPGP